MRPNARVEGWRLRALVAALLVCFAGSNHADEAVADTTVVVDQPFISRAEVRQQGPVTVRAATLTDEESENYFGASLADRGIQALWMSVDNASDSSLRILPIVTDATYFSAAEVEELLSAWWRGSTNALIAMTVSRSQMPEIIPPKQTITGFVFTHREGGLKFVQIGLVSRSEEYLFRFIQPISGITYAIEEVHFGNIYPASAIEDVDIPMLREKLEKLPCCTTNKSADRNGDPLNLVVIGRGIDALFSFISRGWKLDEPFDAHSIYRTIRAFLFRSEYLNAPVSPLYVFGREQDVALQKARNTVSLRNHLRLWLAPYTVGGLQVWVGQISRDIGIKLTTQSWYLTTHRISPAMDQDRFYLLQDLTMSGAVSRFGFVPGVGVSSMPNPRVNLTGDPYLTDGLRLVVFLDTLRRPFQRIELLDWEHHP